MQCDYPVGEVSATTCPECGRALITDATWDDAALALHQSTTLLGAAAISAGLVIGIWTVSVLVLVLIVVALWLTGQAAKSLRPHRSQTLRGVLVSGLLLGVPALGMTGTILAANQGGLNRGASHSGLAVSCLVPIVWAAASNAVLLGGLAAARGRRSAASRCRVTRVTGAIAVPAAMAAAAAGAWGTFNGPEPIAFAVGILVVGTVVQAMNLWPAASDLIGRR